MQTTSFQVTGGRPLSGSITPKGAKNEALQVICAPLLTTEKVSISNIPDILDVRRQIELLQGLGVTVERINHDTYSFQAEDGIRDFCLSRGLGDVYKRQDKES